MRIRDYKNLLENNNFEFDVLESNNKQELLHIWKNNQTPIRIILYEHSINNDYIVDVYINSETNLIKDEMRQLEKQLKRNNP